jgi:hypothetical protein
MVRLANHRSAAHALNRSENLATIDSTSSRTCTTAGGQVRVTPREHAVASRPEASRWYYWMEVKAASLDHDDLQRPSRALVFGSHVLCVMLLH